jgi:hypothetical protein
MTVSVDCNALGRACDREDMEPAGFDLSLSYEWTLWVLAHGLPEMPGPEFAIDQSVPVAYWIGPTTAAVLHIRRIRTAAYEQDVDSEHEVVTETDIEVFRLVDGSWEGRGGGGGGWDDESPLARIDVPPDHVDLHGMNCGGVGDSGSKALWGEVGTDAAFTEVIQAGCVTRRRVEAPTGAFVVSAEYEHPFTVRVLDSRENLLAEVWEPAGSDL